MKKLRLLLLIACTLSVWQMKGQVAITLPPSSIVIPIGNQTLMNQTINGSSGVWYSWVNDSSSVSMDISMTTQGLQNSLSSAELYAVNSGSLVMLDIDTLIGNDILLFAKNLMPNTILYLNIINTSMGCRSCTPANPIINLSILNVTPGCTGYVQPPCEYVKDGGFEFFNIPCPLIKILSGNYYNNFAPCYWNLPAFTTGQFADLGSADYYNDCAPTTPIGSSSNSTNNVFTGGYTSISANTGNGYVGFYAHGGIGPTGSLSNYREYVTEALALPLVATNTYVIKLNLRLAYLSGQATPNVKCMLSNAVPVQLSAGVLPITGQLLSFGAPAVTNKLGWTQLTYTFVATGSYNQITIGNFDNDASTTIINVGGIGNYGLTSYYFLDDVSIKPASTFSVASQNISLCLNSPQTVTLSVSPPTTGVTYSWSATPATASLSAQTGSAVVVSPTVTTTYTITNGLPGCLNTTNAQVTVNPAFNTPLFVASTPTMCAGSVFDINPAVATFGIVSFTLYPMATVAPNAINQNGVYIGVNTYTTGTNTYTVGLEYANGCVLNQTLSVSVNTLTPSYTIAPTTLCSGQTVTLTTDANIAYPSSLLNIDWGDGAGATNYYSQPQTYVYATAGTYTVIATGFAGGCQSTYTQAIQVLPAGTTPTISISPSPQALCLGSCATYTANGALTYTWSTGVQTQTATLCPTVTTSYYVKGTNACGLTGIKYITIGVTPLQGPIPAFAVPNPICPGAVSHLLTNGATSYTWIPGNFNGSNYPVFPLVTTSYTVFGTNGCGTSSAVATVSVLSNAPPTVTIVSSNYYPCNGSAITLTANVSPVGTYTYNWQAPINQSTQVVSFTPTNNAVYSCYVTNQCGSTQLAQTCVSLESTKCCVSSETMSFVTIPTISTLNNLSSVSYNIIGTITIAGNVTWNNSDFKMQQGAKIVVLPNASLTLNKCNLYSCKDMWEGITVLSNGSSSGSVTVANGTVIEDAYKAIAYDGLNTAYLANISVFGSDLNKNYIGVSLKNTTPNTTPVPLNSFYASQYRTQASLTSPGSSLKCSNGFYAPSVKPYGYKGFDAYNQTQTYVLGKNTGAPNNFDRLDFGYYGFNSNINIQNGIFNNIVGSNGAGSPPPFGVAIYSESSPSVTNSFVRVETTRHTQVWRGIELKNIKDVFVETNDISNTTTSPAGCGSGCIGSVGIMITNLRNMGYVSDNKITNSYNGIVTLFNQVVASPTFSYGVSTNTITTTGSGYCVTAIVLQDAVNNFGVAGANISIANNPISNVQNGILSNNIKSGLRISNNPIGIQFVTTGLRYGIRLNGTLKAYVDNNTISSTGATNANLRGIYMQLSPNCKVQCNTISNVGQCVLYEGNNTSLINGFTNNAMSNSKDGLVLKSNGVIGQQGFILIGTNIVSGNTWSVPTGSWGNSKTLTDLSGGAINSSAQNSKLYVSNNPTENPWQVGGVFKNKTIAPGNYGTDNYFQFGPSNTLIVGNGASLSCPVALPYAQRVMPVQPIATIGQLLVQDQSLTDLINTSINYGVNNIPTQFLQRQYVYNAMKQAQVVTTNSTLTTFFNSNTNTGLGQFAGVDSLIIKLQHAQASALNATASTGTPLEQNHQQINTQLLNKLLNANYNYSASDMSTLYGIAGKCPLSDGNAVYQARALLCYIEDRVIEFTDSCDGDKPSGARIGHADDNGNSYVEEMADNFILYPNPNNGTMQLLYSLNQAKTATLTVYDITGKQVYAKDLDTSTSLVDVSINNLSQGVYYYKIIDANSKVLKSDKLIIIK